MVREVTDVPPGAEVVNRSRISIERSEILRTTLAEARADVDGHESANLSACELGRVESVLARIPTQEAYRYVRVGDTILRILVLHDG